MFNPFIESGTSAKVFYTKTEMNDLLKEKLSVDTYKEIKELAESLEEQGEVIEMFKHGSVDKDDILSLYANTI